MRCPHCSLTVIPEELFRQQFADGTGMLFVEVNRCPGCRRCAIEVSDFRLTATSEGPPPKEVFFPRHAQYIWPPHSTRDPIPDEVPEPYHSLAKEAGQILRLSPRASAALSRRCLQQLLREKAGAGAAPKNDLFFEIEWVIENASLPAHLQDGLHELREIGNMAAHPNKSTATGEYIDVEPGEADWSLDILEGLFDFYFVQPARTAARKAGLAARLGKVPSP